MTVSNTYVATRNCIFIRTYEAVLEQSLYSPESQFLIYLGFYTKIHTRDKLSLKKKMHERYKRFQGGMWLPERRQSNIQKYKGMRSHTNSGPICTSSSAQKYRQITRTFNLVFPTCKKENIRTTCEPCVYL